MARVLAAFVVTLAVLLPIADAQCQSSIGGTCGGASRPREANCCTTGYCQPWNNWYYQCLTPPAKCPSQETDIDYYGNDLKTIFGLSPADCCETCSTTSGCAAYTFVNENSDGKTACYLKTSATGRVVKKGAVSAKLAAVTTPTPTSSTCSAKLGDGCGNAQAGKTCCPTGAYCQPWNQYYYQCIALPSAAKCPEVYPGVDFYGDDLRTVFGLLPGSCCDACYNDADCAAYTFVNENADGRTACYLKAGEGTRGSNAKAVSGFKACVI